MDKPKYQIGERLTYENKEIGLTIRGVMITSFGYRYFIQVDASDNSFTLNDDDMDEMIERCAFDKTDY
jgi:hypothetical protein